MAVGGVAGIVLCFLSMSALASSPISSQKIEEIVKAHDVKTIEQLLPHLPTDYLSQYTLIYRSRSLHQSSRLSPRAVVFGSDASFIMAFNGDPNHVHYYSIDIMEYDQAKKVYEPRELIFSPDQQTQPVMDRDPFLCATCHGSVAGVQPNRSTYLLGLAPGVYGSVNDQYTPIENGFYSEYLLKSRHQGRYQYLPDQALPQDQSWPSLKPNTMLGTVLNRRYFHWLAEYLKSKPALSPFRYALLASVECALSSKNESVPWESNLENYVSPEVISQFPKPLSGFLTSVAYSQHALYATKLTDREQAVGEKTPPEYLVDIQVKEEQFSPSFLYLVTQLLNEPLLTAELTKMAQDNDDQMGGIMNLAQELYPFLLDPAQDKVLYDLHVSYEKSMAHKFSPFDIRSQWGSVICPLLKEKSVGN